MGLDYALRDQKPVDLACHRLQSLVRGVTRLEERDQEGPADLAERCLDAPQDLVDEEQIVLLDIGFGSEAFATDQPYHLFAPAGQALRRPVGHIAERMYHLENALARGGPHQVLSVHDA